MGRQKKVTEKLCGACGRAGHIRTNKICLMWGSVPTEPRKTRKTKQSTDTRGKDKHQEPELTLSHEDECQASVSRSASSSTSDSCMHEIKWDSVECEVLLMKSEEKYIEGRITEYEELGKVREEAIARLTRLRSIPRKKRFEHTKAGIYSTMTNWELNNHWSGAIKAQKELNTQTIPKLKAQLVGIKLKREELERTEKESRVKQSKTAADKRSQETQNAAKHNMSSEPQETLTEIKFNRQTFDYQNPQKRRKQRLETMYSEDEEMPLDDAVNNENETPKCGVSMQITTGKTFNDEGVELRNTILRRSTALSGKNNFKMKYRNGQESWVDDEMEVNEETMRVRGTEEIDGGKDATIRRWKV